MLRVGIVLVAVAVYVSTLPSAFGLSGDSASNSSDTYGYGYGYGLHRVPVCHKGHTIVIPEPAIPAHLMHGDTIGACP